MPEKPSIVPVSLTKRQRLAVAVALLFVLNLFLILLVTGGFTAGAVTYKQGSTGDAVRQIQTRLKSWGYYSGAVDGVYGPKTAAAVKFFQSKNGLVADGICGIRTLEKIGLPTGVTNAQSANRNNDIDLLARVISAEARGEPYSGQVAVGAVILNRIKHPSFPNTLSGVIYQPGAFSCLNDGQFDKPVADSAHNAARDAMNGVDPTGGAIYYYNPNTATNQWIRSRPVLKTIGNHKFCS